MPTQHDMPISMGPQLETASAHSLAYSLAHGRFKSMAAFLEALQAPAASIADVLMARIENPHVRLKCLHQLLWCGCVVPGWHCKMLDELCQPWYTFMGLMRWAANLAGFERSHSLPPLLRYQMANA